MRHNCMALLCLSVVPFVSTAGAKPLAQADLIKAHLEFLGYTVETASESLVAKHSEKFRITIRELAGGMLLTGYVDIGERKKDRLKALELVNRLNTEATVARAYLNKDGYVVFEGWLSGYEKSTFARYLESWDEDTRRHIARFVREEDAAKPQAGVHAPPTTSNQNRTLPRPTEPSGSTDDFSSAITAGNVTQVRRFLDDGANPNAADMRGITVLMIASHSGHVGVANVLAAHGAKVNARNEAGVSALMYAVSESHADVVKALVTAGADVDLTDSSGDNAFSYVRMSDARRFEILQDLVKAPVAARKPLPTLAQEVLRVTSEFKNSFTTQMVLRLPSFRIGGGALGRTKQELEQEVRELERDIEQTKKEKRLIDAEGPVFDAIIKVEAEASQFASNPLSERAGQLIVTLQKLTDLCSALIALADFKDLTEAHLGNPLVLNNARLQRYIRLLADSVSK